MKFLLIQGANLNSLGHRQGTVYDDTTAGALDAMLLDHAHASDYALDIFYTNLEGEAINKVYESAAEGVDGILINPAGFTYNAFALRDCLKYVAPPYIEIHLTNLNTRNIHSVMAEAATGVIQGFGTDSYLIGLEAMMRLVAKGGDK